MYNFEAKIISGKGRGKRIGFPTINLNKEKLNIPFGVYIVEIIFLDKILKGLMHYGPKKTFNEGVSVEIYINDFNQEIYNNNVKVNVGKKIRDVIKFKDAAELKKQIKNDLKEIVIKN